MRKSTTISDRYLLGRYNGQAGWSDSMNNILQKPFKFVLIILVAFTAIRMIGTPMSLKYTSEIRFHRCQSNMRLIEAAIETYNMDHRDAQIKYNVQFSDIESRLINSGHLKTAIHCPGSYGYEPNSFLRFIYGIYLHSEGLPLPPGNYSTSATGSITCSLHGPLLP